MSRSPVFVLSSIFEGLPGALIQAMACGCRVVSTDGPGGSREVLQGCERSHGRLVPTRNSAALADAIKSMLDEAEQRPGRVGHRVERFTQQASVDQYLEALGVRVEAPASVMAVDRQDMGVRA
jgi:glycosyltransferase involved in cell wall biosynthesis